MTILKCDRCGECYSEDEFIDSFKYTDPQWRYEIAYNPYPDPVYSLDLCAKCTKFLYSWLNKYHKDEDNNEKL